MWPLLTLTDSPPRSNPAFGRFAGKWWLQVNGGLRLRHQHAGMMGIAAVLHLVAESASIRRVGASQRRFGALAVCGLHRRQNGQLAAARAGDVRRGCGRGRYGSLRARRDTLRTVPQFWWRGRSEERRGREDGAICSCRPIMQNGIVTFACARYECRVLP